MFPLLFHAGIPRGPRMDKDTKQKRNDSANGCYHLRENT